MNIGWRQALKRINTAGVSVWPNILVGLVLSLAVVGTALAQAKITFNLKDADIETVIATVSEFTGKNFIIDPRVKGKVTIISSRPMDRDEVYQAFLSLLEVHSFAAVHAGNVIKIVPDVNAKQSNTPVVDRSSGMLGDEMVTQVIEIKNVSAAQLVPILRPLIPQQGHLAAYAPTNVLIVSDRADNVQRLIKIIVRIDVTTASDIEVFPLKHASATELVRILETLRRQEKRAEPKGGSSDGPVLVADERTNSILISGDKADRLSIRAIISHLDTPLETTGNTHVIYLHYAQAEDLVPVLTGLGESLEQEKKGGAKTAAPVNRMPLNIQAHESTNALVITAPPDLFRNLERVIRQLDVRRAQVLVEAVIAEVSNNRIAELGVQWLLDGTPGGDGPVGGTNFGSSNIVNVASSIAAGQVPPISPGVFAGFGRFDSENVNFAALVNALEGDGTSNVLSKPTIVTLDNEEAEIVVGQEVPFLTGSFSSTGSGSTPTNPFQTIERENVGVTLKVKPQINEGDAIQLEIEQKSDSLAASSASAADLITNTRSIRTSVLVDDGSAIVLGGLVTDEIRQTEQKVPGLGDIPLLGALFRYRQTTKEKTNLMVFLRPKILRDAAMSTAVTHSKYNFIRNEQIKHAEKGIAFMRNDDAPLLPEFNEYLELPPPFEGTGATSTGQP